MPTPAHSKSPSRQQAATTQGRSAQTPLIGYPAQQPLGNAAAAEKLASAPRLWDPQAYTHIASNIQPDVVDAAAGGLWAEMSDSLTSGVPAWDESPAADALRVAVRTGAIRPGFDSGWIDDGFDDTLDLGLLDVDVRVKADLYISDSVVVREGDATFGGSTTGSLTNTKTDTVGGSGTGAIAPGGMGGNASGNVAHADATALGAAEASSGSMVLPAVLEKAKAHVEITISMNHTLGRPITSSRMVECGEIYFKRLAFW